MKNFILQDERTATARAKPTTIFSESLPKKGLESLLPNEPFEVVIDCIYLPKKVVCLPSNGTSEVLLGIEDENKEYTAFRIYSNEKRKDNFERSTIFSRILPGLAKTEYGFRVVGDPIKENISEDVTRKIAQRFEQKELPFSENTYNL